MSTKRTKRERKLRKWKQSASAASILPDYDIQLQAERVLRLLDMLAEVEADRDLWKQKVIAAKSETYVLI